MKNRVLMLMFVLVSAFFLLSFSIQEVFAESEELAKLILNPHIGPPSCSIFTYEADQDVHDMVLSSLREGKEPISVLDGFVKFSRKSNYTYKSSAGVFIDSRGFILTNFHCIDEENDNNLRIIILWSAEYGGKKEVLEFKLVKGDKKKDLALLEIVWSKRGRKPIFPTVIFASRNPGVLKKGISISNPLGLSFSVASFEVNGIRSAKDLNSIFNRELFDPNLTILQIFGGIINSGSSGGPLFTDKNGEFVGIVAATTMKYNSPLRHEVQAFNTGIAFAISVEDIKAWLRQVAPHILIPEYLPEYLKLQNSPDFHNGVK